MDTCLQREVVPKATCLRKQGQTIGKNKYRNPFPEPKLTETENPPPTECAHISVQSFVVYTRTKGPRFPNRLHSPREVKITPKSR